MGALRPWAPQPACQKAGSSRPVVFPRLQEEHVGTMLPCASVAKAATAGVQPEKLQRQIAAMDAEAQTIVAKVEKGVGVARTGQGTALDEDPPPNFGGTEPAQRHRERYQEDKKLRH